MLWTFWLYISAQAVETPTNYPDCLSTNLHVGESNFLGHSGSFSTYYLHLTTPGGLCHTLQPGAGDFINGALPFFVWDSEQVLSENKQVFVEMWLLALDTDLHFCCGDSFFLEWGWFLFMKWLWGHSDQSRHHHFCHQEQRNYWVHLIPFCQRCNHPVSYKFVYKKGQTNTICSCHTCSLKKAMSTG